jgi:hypothetical protein
MELGQLRTLTVMMLIGDGTLALLRPHRNARAWSLGPEPWRDLMQQLCRRPNVLRAIGAAEIAAGITWVLASRVTEDAGCAGRSREEFSRIA